MKRGVLIGIIIIALISITSASFGVGNLSHVITKDYAFGANIYGWINISFEDEPVTSIFKDSFGNEITSLELLTTAPNSKFKKNCSTIDCNSDYSATNFQTTKQFYLRSNESNTIGIKLIGNIVSISSLSFDLASNAAVSCKNQIKIDFFNNAFVYGNNKSFTELCPQSRVYGCFNISESTIEGKLDSTPYCQKVQLGEYPSFRIGAWVKEEVSGGTVTMRMYNKDSAPLSSCNLSAISTIGGEISCEVNYLITKKDDYYICISHAGTGTYKIKSQTFNKCGFHSYPISSATASYQIFANGKSYATPGNLVIYNTLPAGDTLSRLAGDYITKKYKGFDCSSGCIIPIKFIANVNQNINLTNLTLIYNVAGVSGVEEKNFNDLTESPALITSKFQKIFLNSGNFSVPNEKGNKTYELSLNGQKIFTEKIGIGSVPTIVSVLPLSTGSSVPTTFRVYLNLTSNITKYKWEFGDGFTKETLDNNVNYTYSSPGSYTLTVTTTDSAQRYSSKEFTIVVQTPIEQINKTLNEYADDITSLKSQIKTYDLFYQGEINSILRLNETEALLRQLKLEYENENNTDDDYNRIMVDILGLEVPNKIKKTFSAESLSLYPNQDNINLEILNSIAEGNYAGDNADQYIQAILLWNQQNINAKISMDKFEGVYDSATVPLITFFELDISKNTPEKTFFVIQELSDLGFAQDYNQHTMEGYVYFEFTDGQIKLSTTEDISFNELPVFFSPSLSALKIVNIAPPKNILSKWILFVLIIIGLFIVAIIVYIILQVWYKKNYESHLFKNRNNLYNILTYIHNSKKSGLSDDDIKSRLKKAGWESEQIVYGLNKYEGKRTGMLELPINGLLNMFNKTEVEKRKEMFTPTSPPKFGAEYALLAGS